jgi:hypothetical protein
MVAGSSNAWVEDSVKSPVFEHAAGGTAAFVLAPKMRRVRGTKTMAHTPLPACRHMQRSRVITEVPPLAAFSKNPSSVLNSVPEQEERHEPRYPRQLDVRYRELTVTSDSLYAVFQARIANMSTGGMCLTTDRPLTPFSTIRGEITLPGSPVGVPCLLQVRWVREVQQGVYLSGLLYLM